MRKSKTIILSTSVCSCRVIDIPPVGKAEVSQIIKHRMSAFYPGSPDDLYLDYIKDGDKAIVFFSPKTRIDSIREEKGNISLYSVWHILDSIKDKEGYYAVTVGEKIDLFIYTDNRLEETRVVDTLPISEDVKIISPGKPVSGKFTPLFQKKKRVNFLLPNLLLFALIVIFPQLAFYRQTLLEEQYVSDLKKEINRLSVEKVQMSASREEMTDLLNQYESLKLKRPLDLSLFLSELSSVLRRDVVIESLVVKDRGFQLNGIGINPLGKMEDFQGNRHFSNVIPYQVKSIKDSSRESFSLTGAFENE